MYIEHFMIKIVRREDDVLVLTGENFDEAIKEFGHIMVKFYDRVCI